MERASQIAVLGNTPASETSSSLSPNTDESSVAPAAPKRTKRWAPRSSKGCINCRTRRVKCDEGKPKCRNCVRRCEPCEPQRRPIVARFVDRSSGSRNSGSGTGADNLVVVPMRGSGLTPLEHDWIECQRATRILLLTMTPDALCKDSASVPNLAITHPVWPPDFTMTERVRQSLGQWLMRRSPFESTPFRKDAAEARHKFDSYTGQALLELSRDIADPTKYAEKQVVKRVAIHIASDISLCSRDLRRHLEGFIAVLKASGGMQTVLETKQLHKISLWLIMIAIIITNTTSPAHDQMAGELYFTRVDIYLLQTQYFFGDFPCPANLLLCISDINDLRRRVASGEACGGGDKLRAAVQALLATIDGFPLHMWRGLPMMPAPDICAMLGTIFRRATRLYGMLTLASHAGIPFDRAQRIGAAAALMDAVRPPVGKIGHHVALTWPVVVAGAAAGAGPASLQAAVDEMLYDISNGTSASDGVALTLQCLRRFWDSGKTEWDECFAEWQASVP